MPTVEIKAGFNVLISNGAGIIVQDNQNPPHYWKMTIGFGLLGAPQISFTDLGTTKPPQN